MAYVRSVIRLLIDDPEVARQVANGGDPLKSLCREEADKFERLMQADDADFGKLTHFERAAVQSYLYQKIRGRLDSAKASDLPEERSDGTP